MAKKLRRAFTIVELVIVIAVIAILAAVLIPTFTSLIQKANESNDVSLATNMNTFLQTDEVLNGKPENMGEVVSILQENGIDISKLTPTQDNNYYLWDQTSNRIIYMDENYELIFSSVGSDISQMNLWVLVTSQEAADKWIAKTLEGGVTVYVYADIQAPEEGYKIDYLNGLYIDDNYVLIGNVSYENSVLESKNNFVINGNIIGNLYINDKDATINHYGTLQSLEIVSVNSESYHENGYIKGEVVIQDGHFVVEKEGSVSNILVKSGGTVKISSNSEVSQLKVEGESAQTAVTINVGASAKPVYVDESKISATIEGANVQTIEYVTNETELRTALAKENYVVLNNDITITDVIAVSKDLVLDGNNYTITADSNIANKRMLWIEENDVNVVLKNINFDGQNVAERGVQINVDIKNVNLSMTNCNIKNITYYTVNICTGAGVNLNISYCELSGWGVINAWSNDYVISVDNSYLIGINDKNYNADGWNDFSTVVCEGDTTDATNNHASSITIEFVNSKIEARSLTGNQQQCIGFNPKSVANVINCLNCEFIYDTANNTTLFYDAGEENKLIINNEQVN